MSEKEQATKKEKLKQKPSKIIENNFYAIKKIAKYVPQYIFWMIFEGVVWGIINSIEIVYTLKLFNAIDGGIPFWGLGGVAWIIAVMGIFYLVAYAFDRWYWLYYFPFMRQKLYYKLQCELFEKAQQADLCCYDDPEYYNDFVWAMDQADTRIIEMTQDVGKLINRIVACTTISSIMFAIDFVIGTVLLVGAACSTFIWLTGNKLSFKKSMEQKSLWRKVKYINRVFHLQDYAKEIRMGGAGDVLQGQYDENNQHIIECEIKYGKKYFMLYGVLNSITGLGTNYFTIIYMFSKLIAGKILLGSFAASINAIWKLRWMVSDFCQRLTRFPEHSLYIAKYREFLERDPCMKNGNIPVPSFEKLTINNVSFCYESMNVVNPEKIYGKAAKYETCEPEKPKEPKTVLQNVSFEIKKGDKIAIVGYNGAGKTTLIKLFMRLYDTTEGEILYNGINIKEFSIEEYRAHLGAVFQDYKLFAATVAENVWGGGYSPEHEDEVRRALCAATFDTKIDELKNGLNTHLTREFKNDGTNLSGGESQKVAIARVFAKPYELIIMDEPSSSLDPLAESKLNHAILNYASDKTVIFISHRLSTTRMADKIIMFDGGKVAEYGTHDELMMQNGKYAEMFNKQAEKYVIEANAV